MRLHRRSNEVCALLVFLLLFGSIQAPAQTSGPQAIGALEAEGSVSVNGTPAAAGVTIYPGDTIRTAANGAAVLTMPDRGSLVIAADSEITFFPSGRGAHFASLRRGSIGLRVLPEALETTIELGNFVLRPVSGGTAGAEMSADGSVHVRCVAGSFGVIEMRGEQSVFLHLGEEAEVSADGKLRRVVPSVPPQPAPGPSPAPSGPTTVPAGKSRAPWIILGVGAGVAGAVAALLIHHNAKQPISAP